jgi:hypothetical protein
MGATPFSARHPQPTLSALVNLQPHFNHPCNPFHFFSEEAPINSESWLTKLQDYHNTRKQRQPSESASCQLQHRTKEQVNQWSPTWLNLITLGTKPLKILSTFVTQRYGRRLGSSKTG